MGFSPFLNWFRLFSFLLSLSCYKLISLLILSISLLWFIFGIFILCTKKNILNNFMGYHSKIFWVFLCILFMVIIMCIYIIYSNVWLFIFMHSNAWLFLINSDYEFYCMFKEHKKIYVYMLMSDYLYVYMLMSDYLCVYILMNDYIFLLYA